MAGTLYKITGDNMSQYGFKFLNIRISGERISKIICFAGSLTVGVYLFHNNPSLRDHLWN